MPRPRKVDVKFKITSVSNPKFVRYYRTMCSNHRSRRVRCILNHREVMKIQDTIWETVADMYKEKEGGVYIDNIGYFCSVMVPRTSWGISGLTGKPLRPGTNGYLYRPVVFDFRRHQYYHIHKALNQNLIRLMKRKSQERRLKLYLNDVKSYRKCFGERNIVDVL